jgi:hypothetical protein
MNTDILIEMTGETRDTQDGNTQDGKQSSIETPSYLNQLNDVLSNKLHLRLQNTEEMIVDRASKDDILYMTRYDKV